MSSRIAPWVLVVVSGACSSSSSSTSPPADGGAPPGCPTGYAECDGNPRTVCETHLISDATSCGACGNVCHATGANEVATCANASCAFVCADGFADCDEDPANGCEATADTCTITTLATVDSPGGLAIDDAYVYYANKGTPPAFTDGTIYKVSKSGGAPIALATGQNTPISVTVGGGRAYWTNGGQISQPNGSVVAVDVNGGAVKILASGVTRPANPILSATRIFFTTRTPPNGTVSSLRQDGSDPQVVATGVFGPSDLEIAGDTLVWATSGTAKDGSDALVERANVDGTQRMQLAVGIPQPNYSLVITTDSVFVGSFADGTIRKLALLPTTQPPPPPPAPTFTGLGEPQEIHSDGKTLYVSTGSAGKVVALPIDGGPATVIASGETFPSYVAIDADYIYWTDGALSGPAFIRKTKRPR